VTTLKVSTVFGNTISLFLARDIKEFTTPEGTNSYTEGNSLFKLIT